MAYIIGIDPGEKHVGWAVIRDGTPVEACEVTPDEAIAMAEQMFQFPTRIAIEEFRLYPDKAALQAYSNMPTSKLIGVLEYIARKQGAQAFLQPADIKRPTEALMKARGMKHLAVVRKQGGHAKDAETHAVYRLLKGTRND